jgi:hypothetical protein
MNKTIEIRGFRKPTSKMKLLVDTSITPKEMATIRYHKLYEQTMIRKAERLENPKRNYLEELKQIIKHAL